jgi:hypothetical protein
VAARVDLGRAGRTQCCIRNPPAGRGEGIVGARSIWRIDGRPGNQADVDQLLQRQAQSSRPRSAGARCAGRYPCSV